MLKEISTSSLRIWPVAEIEAEWERLGQPTMCLRRKPAATEEERHERVWQAWLYKAIEEMGPKFTALAGGMLRGNWETRDVPLNQACGKVDPDGCDVLAGIFWYRRATELEFAGRVKCEACGPDLRRRTEAWIARHEVNGGAMPKANEVYTALRAERPHPQGPATKIMT